MKLLAEIRGGSSWQEFVGEAQAGTRLWQAFPGEISGRNLWLEKVAETGLTESGTSGKLLKSHVTEELKNSFDRKNDKN